MRSIDPSFDRDAWRSHRLSFHGTQGAHGNGTDIQKQCQTKKTAHTTSFFSP
jgi:hypothetical protein